ncbi:MAG TPA: pilus assembly protein PilM, partial [Solirubrobacteraceae bacterium]|nr:pilus assembly protein PilM [Solirubrobacteraceae bacterium]
MGRSRTAASVGLTIEPGRIAAAQAAVNGVVVIQDGGRAELEPGIVRDGEVADREALADALRALWREHSDLDKRVRIGVANARIVVRTLYLPPITDPKQLATAVRFQAKDEIPMPLENAVLDFHAVGIVDTPEGPRQRIVLVAARQDMLMDMLGAARAAGLKPIGIDLSAFGMIRALPTTPGDDAGLELFVSVGGLTNLAISEGGICGFTRVAGSGLESLAVELAERRELTLDHARMWLHHVGLEEDLAKIEGDTDIVADARTVLTTGARRIAGEIRGSLD